MTEPDAKRPRALQEKQYITYTLVKYKELDCTSLQAYLASRRIDATHRLVYTVQAGARSIVACRYQRD